jgi:hypothetical protein
MKIPDKTTVSADSIVNITSRRRFLSAAAISALAGTGAVSAGAFQSSSSAAVTFKDQGIDEQSVTIQSVTMPKGGFVAIHDSRLRDGKALESVIGVSKKLGAGTHENVTVTLFDVPGGEYENQMLDTDQTLIAMPHRDTNGNSTYDFLTSGGKTDGPYTKNKNAVVDAAKITVSREENKLPVSVTFEDQTTDGKTANILSVTLTEGGYVAVHDSSLLDGKVIESVIGVSGALDAGTHENVEVALFEGVPGTTYEMSRLTGDQTLIAMAHRDTNDNATYDFVKSQGEKDDPYTKNETPVTDKARLTVTEKDDDEQLPMTFAASLAGENEVPPVTTDACGKAHFKLADHEEGPHLHYTLTVQDITDVTQAHIHVGGPNENGPVVVPLFQTDEPTSCLNGVLAEGSLTAADLVGPLRGKDVSALAEEITAGNTYVNVHTTQHPKGEIRGQIHETE